MQPSRSVVRATDLVARPWPNGLGITRDIHGSIPSGWLVSVADLVEDAAFSHFSGCDRVFTLIEGGGVTLTLDERFAMPCLPFVPASFPGDRPTVCTMGAGTARAFNLFVDRDAAIGEINVHIIAASHAIHVPSDAVAVFCAAGTITVAGEALNAGDTVIGAGATSIQTSDVAAIVIVVRIERRPCGLQAA